MYLLSLFCLVLVSSSVCAGSGYDSYRTADRLSSGSSGTLLDNPKTVSTNSGYSGYSSHGSPSFDSTQAKYSGMLGSSFDSMQPKSFVQRDQGRMQMSGYQFPSLDQPESLPLPPTPADLLCRGKQAETIITLTDAHKYIVCTGEGKGELQTCPSGLYYSAEAKRCERRLNVVDPCQKQPCLHGGECVSKDASSFECRCPQGFSGDTCQLDSRVCEQKKPCGTEKCQSFRVGASLPYICIIGGGRAYGLNAQQAIPNPCMGTDGQQSLITGNEGFIICDGAQMFVESCPGGTVWDDINKGCIWPDMQWASATSQRDQTRPVQQSYSYSKQQQDRPAPTSYTHGQTSFVQPLQDTRPMTSYSGYSVQRQEDRPTTEYGQQSAALPQREDTRPMSTLTSSYGQQSQREEERPVSTPAQRTPIIQRQQDQLPASNYGQTSQRQDDRPMSTLTSNYGSMSVPLREERPQVVSTYPATYQQPQQLVPVRDVLPLPTAVAFSSYSQQQQQQQPSVRPTAQFDNTPRQSSSAY